MFQKISGSEKAYKKGGGGSIERFCRKIFVSKCRKISKGNLLSVCNFGYRKNLCFKGLCYDIPSKLFCLTVPKHFVEEPSVLCFRKFPLAKKFMEKKGGEGVSQFSVESFLSHTAEKTFVVEPFSPIFHFGYGINL